MRWGRGRSHTHNFRVGADYNIAKDHQLSFVYNGGYSTSHNWTGVTGTQVSTTHGNSTDWLHNGRLDYRTPFGLKAGAELTYYRSPSDQLLHSRMQDEELDFYTEDCQRINRWKFFLAQEHSLGKGWDLNYGAIYTTSIDNSYQYYYDPETGEQLTSSRCLKQYEVPPPRNRPGISMQVSARVSATNSLWTLPWLWSITRLPSGTSGTGIPSST